MNKILRFLITILAFIGLVFMKTLDILEDLHEKYITGLPKI